MNLTMNLTGTFVSGEHPTEGTVQIVVESEQRFVELQPETLSGIEHCS
jgi:hypothetical protein